MYNIIILIAIVAMYYVPQTYQGTVDSHPLFTVCNTI